jgi:Fe-S cluster assembly protein SufB
MVNTLLKNFINKPYKYGFNTNIKTEKIKKGLNTEIIHLISEKKKEPKSILKFRLKAFNYWRKINEPIWAYLKYKKPNYQNICYYSGPKKQKIFSNIEPELVKILSKLDISTNEKKNLAIDFIFDSVSISKSFQNTLVKYGVIFCSISEAIKYYPFLVNSYLGVVIPSGDNFFTALNSSTFTDGSFCYIPKDIQCPLDLTTYFRINDKETGQFERTLIISEENSKINYIEGCTAAKYDKNQLHAAIVELIALNNAFIKYSTVQNWYAGDIRGNGGIYNFVTKRGLCSGIKSKISWNQIETGSKITWKYPSCILSGKASKGEFYSVALTKNNQQADTGTKMIHIGEKTSSHIISKGISNGNSKNTYRGLVKIGLKALKARNYSQCDSLLLNNKSSANTFPYIQVQNTSSHVEHEASTSKINEEQIFYFLQRGISLDCTIKLIINGFCKDVFSQLPLEFVLEANQLLNFNQKG